MTSLTMQKHDLRGSIHNLFVDYLDRHPDKAQELAICLVGLLSKRMTINELAHWMKRLQNRAINDNADD